MVNGVSFVGGQSSFQQGVQQRQLFQRVRRAETQRLRAEQLRAKQEEERLRKILPFRTKEEFFESEGFRNLDSVQRRRQRVIIGQLEGRGVSFEEQQVRNVGRDLGRLQKREFRLKERIGGIREKISRSRGFRLKALRRRRARAERKGDVEDVREFDRKIAEVSSPDFLSGQQERIRRAERQLEGVREDIGGIREVLTPEGFSVALAGRRRRDIPQNIVDRRARSRRALEGTVSGPIGASGTRFIRQGGRSRPLTFAQQKSFAGGELRQRVGGRAVREGFVRQPAQSLIRPETPVSQPVATPVSGQLLQTRILGRETGAPVREGFGFVQTPTGLVAVRPVEKESFKVPSRGVTAVGTQQLFRPRGQQVIRRGRIATDPIVERIGGFLVGTSERAIRGDSPFAIERKFFQTPTGQRVAFETREFGRFLYEEPRKAVAEGTLAVGGGVVGGQLIGGTLRGVAGTGAKGLRVARASEKVIGVGGVAFAGTEIATAPAGEKIRTTTLVGLGGAGAVAGFRTMVPKPTAVTKVRETSLKSLIGEEVSTPQGQKLMRLRGRAGVKEVVDVTEFGVKRQVTRRGDIDFVGLQRSPDADVFDVRAVASLKGAKPQKLEGFFFPERGVTALKSGRQSFISVRRSPITTVTEGSTVTTTEPSFGLALKGRKFPTIVEQFAGLSETEAFPFQQTRFSPRTQRVGGLEVIREGQGVIFPVRGLSLGAFGRTVGIAKPKTQRIPTEVTKRLPSEVSLLLPEGRGGFGRVLSQLRGRRGELRQRPQTIFGDVRAGTLRKGVSVGELPAPSFEAFGFSNVGLVSRAVPILGFPTASRQRVSPRERVRGRQRVLPLERIIPAQRVRSASDVALVQRIIPVQKVTPVQRVTPAERVTPVERVIPAERIIPFEPVPPAVPPPPVVFGFGLPLIGLPTGGGRGGRGGTGRGFSFAPDVTALIGGEVGGTVSPTGVLTGLERRRIRGKKVVKRKKVRKKSKKKVKRRK